MGTNRKKIALIVTVFLFYLISSTTSAQSIEVATDKTGYKLDETIKLKYISSIKIDSIKQGNLDNFEIIKKPVSIDQYYENGKIVSKYVRSFFLKAKKPGPFLIDSPEFYFKGNVLRSKPIKITITGVL